jgi:TonB family protein
LPLRIRKEIQEVSRGELRRFTSEIISPSPMKNHISNSAALLIAAILLTLAVTVQAQESPPPGYDSAIELYKQGDNAGAIEILEKVVREHEDNPDVWYFLGLAYYKMGAFGQARRAFDQLLRLRPDSADAHAKFAYTLILASESEQAVANAQRAIELGDTSAEPHYAIAEANLRVGNFEKAVDNADQALRIDSGFGLALITKSMALYRLNRYAESILALEDFLKANPNDTDADVWREQLKRIKATESREKLNGAAATSQPTEEPVFKGKEVTTKVRVLDKPEPTYNDSARRAGVTGTVVLQAVFAGDGSVKNVFVARALAFGLTSQAVKAAKNIHFTPATKDGKPVSMWLELQYNFNLY